MTERSTISRRTFLKGTAATASVFLAPEVYSTAHTLYSKFKRNERPELLEKIPDSSIVYGFAPHKYNTDLVYRYRDKLGSQPHILNFYIEGCKPFENEDLYNQINQATQMDILPMLSFGVKYKDLDLAMLTQHLSRINSPFLFRPWYEKNGFWTDEWYTQIVNDDFKNIWQTTREYFATHLPDAHFIISYNTSDVADSFEAIIPEAGYFDFVGLDANNKFSPNQLDYRHYYYPNLTPEELLGPDIKTLQEIAPGVPLLITEVNAINNPDWVINAIKFSVRAGAKAWVVFDWNKGGVSWNEHDWSILNDEALIGKISEELRNNYYDVHNGAENTLSKLLG